MAARYRITATPYRPGGAFGCPVLAALGRFDEAARVLERTVAASEPRLLELLAEGRALELVDAAGLPTPSSY